MDFRTIIAIIEKILLERMSLRLREQSEKNYFFYNYFTGCIISLPSRSKETN